jgi:hypothetical protein
MKISIEIEGRAVFSLVISTHADRIADTVPARVTITAKALIKGQKPMRCDFTGFFFCLIRSEC